MWKKSPRWRAALLSAAVFCVLCGCDDLFGFIAAKPAKSVNSPGSGEVQAAYAGIHVFNSLEDMGAWLKAAPVNSKSQPYKIILQGESVADMNIGSNDGLGKLFAALNRKYVSLDLGLCSGQEIKYTAESLNPINREYLTSLRLPKNLTRIGDFAFKGCSSLIDIEFPMTLLAIGNYAFLGCRNLRQVVCYADIPPAMKATDFDVPESTLIIKVRYGVVETYKATAGWKDLIAEISGM